MQGNRHDYGSRRKTWLQIAEALVFIVLLVVIVGGALYLTYLTFAIP